METTLPDTKFLAVCVTLSFFICRADESPDGKPFVPYPACIDTCNTNGDLQSETEVIIKISIQKRQPQNIIIYVFILSSGLLFAHHGDFVCPKEYCLLLRLLSFNSSCLVVMET